MGMEVSGGRLGTRKEITALSNTFNFEGASTSGQQEVGGSRDQRDRNRKDSNRKSDKHHDSARYA